MEDRALVARDLDKRRLLVFRCGRGTSADGRSDAAACEDRALSETKERGGSVSLFIRESKGRSVERLLWSEDSDREGRCAYNKDELSLVVS